MVTGLDYFVVLVYFGVMLVCGYIGARMSKTHEDYLVAGRRLGFWTFFACMSAVILGGGATFGTAKLGYLHGISGFWMVFMYGLGILALAVLVTTRISNLRIMTLSEMLGMRYDEKARIISALIAAVYAALIATLQIVAIGTIIQSVLGWAPKTSMLVGGLIVLAYTLAGGMWSVTLTDVIQFWLMTLGVLLMLVMGLAKVGGFAGLQTALEPSYFDLGTIGGKRIFSFFLLFFLGFLVGQDIWQRVFTAKDSRTARSGTVAAGLYCIGYAVVVAIIGMCAAVIVPGLQNAQSAFPEMAIRVLPPGLTGLVLAGTLSALMSTADGPILAASTLVIRDLWIPILKPRWDDRHQTAAYRWVTLAVGVFAIVSAVWIQDVLNALDLAYDLLSGAIVVPVIAALFWKRATAQGAVLSMILSSIVVIVGLIREGLSATNPIIYGVVTSLVSLVVISLLTPPPDSARMKEWEERMMGAPARVGDAHQG